MPLHKRSYFYRADPPKDLDPRELVFQIRFTREIFKDYRDYLSRLNLYRHRVWTCKATGKTNLTYEEALVSERRASEKVQQIPKDLAVLILREVQFSTLKLKDLVDSISAKLLDHVYEGAEMFAKKGDYIHACKILDTLEDKKHTIRYKVGWFDTDRAISSTSIINPSDLIKKKPPFSRDTLKSFIRESTSRSCPWVVYDNIAKKHGVSTEPPEELKDKINADKGQRWLKVDQKRKKTDQPVITPEEAGNEKSKYPIEDLLVKPGPHDPVFTERPDPCREFCVPAECIGDLLMTWDFCCSFCRLLKLFPFSLEDLEKSICHKDSDLALLVESHISLLRLVLEDEGDFFEAIQSKKRKSKIRQSNWTKFLCDFLEMVDVPDLSDHLDTIQNGQYGLLDPSIKLAIFRELVSESVATDSVRDQLEGFIEQQRELAATKREEQKRKREESLENGKEIQETELNETSVNGSQAVENGEAKKSSGSATQKRSKKDSAEKTEVDSEMEKRSIRTNALGRDRNHNRYWFFRREGRLFVESADFKQWGYYTSKQELDALIGSLNPKGERECALKRQLEKYYTRLSGALQKRSKDVAQKIFLEEAVVRRSTRVKAPPRDSPSMAFLRYTNRWKEE